MTHNVLYQFYTFFKLSFCHLMIKGSEHEVFKAIFNQFMVKSLPDSDLEGLKRACSDEKFAFLCAETIFKNIAKEANCQFVSLDVVAKFTTTFELTKNSPYLSLFNKQ